MAVMGYTASVGTLVWVKATTNFFVAGKHILIGDYVQVKEGVGNWLNSLDRATIVEASEVEAAQLVKAAKANKAPVQAEN